MKTSEINFKVTLDENHLPEKLNWQASDGGGSGECKSVMVALWDSQENNTLRIDLWTKDMSVDEMKKFYHQNVMTLTETYLRATGDTLIADKVKKIFVEIGKESGVLS